MSATPTLRIDHDSPVPAYQQILSGLRALLVAGNFRPGDRLPTVRQLAIDLCVHHNTVAEAYRHLSDEGWLDLRRHRGASVKSRSTPGPDPRATANFSKRLEELVAEALAKGVPPSAVKNATAKAARNVRASIKRAFLNRRRVPHLPAAG
jgi:GntR family transcriptional regulator